MAAAERTHELNATAAALARSLCDEFATPERPRFVAGSIGPTGILPSSDDPHSGGSPSRARDIFREQARALVEGGATC